MRTLGIGVKVVGGRVEVDAVVLVSAEHVKVEGSLTYRVDPNEDEALQLRSLSNAFRTLLKDGPDAVVVASFDYTPRQRIADWVKMRLRTEGALAAMAREYSPVVSILNGRDMGVVYGYSKEDLRRRAQETYPDHDEVAVMAAIAAGVLLG